MLVISLTFEQAKMMCESAAVLHLRVQIISAAGTNLSFFCCCYGADLGWNDGGCASVAASLVK